MKLKVLFLTLCLVPVVFSKARRYTRLMTDPLSRTKCDLVCLEVEKDNKAACRINCKDQEVKPGTCPSSDSPLWAEACVEACNRDSQCDGTQRCCRHGCGSTCSEPTDLLTLPGLPARPVISDPKERHRSIIVKWSDGVGDLARAVPGRILYILEEQHHLGPKYEEARLGDWSMLLRTNKTQVSLRDLLKPGRWYRFRVAAVSAAGTRGYSAPSTAFTPRRGPRPPPQPKRLRVTPLATDNGTIAVRLQWKEPRSDLPVLRYKVYWSRRVRGIQSDLDSVVVNHQAVAKEQNHFDITDLQQNSMYFLQVQTISQFGLGKLRSDKAEIFYNTTNINDHPQELAQKRGKKIRGLKLQRVVWHNHRIRARVSWEPIPNIDGRARRYFVHWETGTCDNKPQKTKKELSASTEESTFEIYELQYGCNYKVHVNKAPLSKTRPKPDSELFVKIPDCNNFQRRLNGTKINCE